MRLVLALLAAIVAIRQLLINAWREVVIINAMNDSLGKRYKR